MDFNALNKLSYGVYIISTKFEGKLYAQIATTVMQVTSNPPAVIVAINKQNFTHDAIQKSEGYNVSVLDTTVTLKDIAHFGFKSGRDIDKFKGVEYNLGKNGLPIITTGVASYLECSLTSTVDAGTHSLFVASITDSVVLSDTDVMTYDYYHKVIKGKSSKFAPSYFSEQNKVEKEKKIMKKLVCSVCGYVYDPTTGDPDNNLEKGLTLETLPEDFVCPLCGVSKDDFTEED